MNVKKALGILFLSLLSFTVFARDFVVSKPELQYWIEEIKDTPGYTPAELSHYYYFTNNYKRDLSHRIFKVKGYVESVRQAGVLYEVRLRGDLIIVYPYPITNDLKNELENLKEGEYIEVIVVGRDTWPYVDVPVWSSGGVYRTDLVIRNYDGSSYEFNWGIIKVDPNPENQSKESQDKSEE